MLGSQTRGGRMEGADKSTELWRHPKGFFEVPKAFHDLISYTRETKSVKLQSRRIDPTPSSNILKKKDSVCSIHTHTEKECVCVWKRMKEGERERERGSERLRVLRVQFERKTFLLSRERTVGHEGNNKWWLKDLMRKGGRERERGDEWERERERERERRKECDGHWFVDRVMDASKWDFLSSMTVFRLKNVSRLFLNDIERCCAWFSLRSVNNENFVRLFL